MAKNKKKAVSKVDKESAPKKKVANSAKIKELEDRISTTKYNKKTQHAIGLYKAQIAKLKEKQESRSKSGPKFEGYQVSKSGDATVILVGFPSVGKSTLLNSLTGAESEVGAYEFTTLSVVPGMMEYKCAKIQILDVPGIVRGAASGKGRGREVLSCIQNADLILMVLDVFNPQYLKVIEKEIRDSHVRVNEDRPDVKIVKTGKGGIHVGATLKLTHLTEETTKAICKEMRIVNADVIIRDDITVDQLIDIIENNKIYMPAIRVLNKIDMVSEKKLKELNAKLNIDVDISADKKINIDSLKEKIFNDLNLIRIYTKEINKKPDMTEPMIVKHGMTIREFCAKLHKDFVNKFRFVRVWGKSAKFPGQKLHLNHVLRDDDIVEIHIN